MEQNLHNVETAPGIEVILLQIGMVSSGTHLVKNHEFQQKKKKSPKFKMFGPLCNQMVNLKTDS